MAGTIVKQGGFFPTREQIMLLKAAIFPASEAIDHWKQWVELQGFKTLGPDTEDLLPKIFDPIDIGSERMMPLIHKNLESFNDPLIRRLKGIHRYTWMLNQRILNRTLEIVNFLKGHGIESIIIKGIPLSSMFYKNMGVRMMSDGDLLIPYEKRDHAIDLLLNSSYIQTTLHPSTVRFTKKYCHSIDLITKANLKIDLHWNLFHEYADKNENDQTFWDNKQSLSLNGTNVFVLSPTHQFFNSMAHGRAWNAVPPFRWAADCSMIYYNDPKAVNWEELADLAHRYHYIPFFKKALILLRDEFRINIPETIIDRLNKLSVSKHEISYHHFLSLPYIDFNKMPIQKTKRILLTKYNYYKVYKQKSFANFILWCCAFLYPGVKKRLFGVTQM